MASAAGAVMLGAAAPALADQQVFGMWLVLMGISLAMLGVGYVSLHHQESAKRLGLGVALSATGVIGVVLALGTIPGRVPLLGVEISSRLLGIYAIGIIAMSCGGLFSGLVWTDAGGPGGQEEGKGRGPGEAHVSRRQRDLVSRLGLVGLMIALVNFISGEIPALARDVDAARFSGNHGLLSYLWVPSLAFMQLSLIFGALGWRRRFLHPALVIGLGLCLGLTGARSFLAMVGLAVAWTLIISKGPNLKWVVAGAVGLIGLVGLTGALRLSGSAAAADRTTYLARRGLEGPAAVFEASIRTGPQVFGRLMNEEARWDGSLGEFFLQDALQFVRLSPMGSDRLVTVALGADPSVVGGLPPTIFGGFFVDGGTAGVAIGGLLVGWASGFLARWARQTNSFPLYVLSGYFAAYVCISSYSYVSLKPSVVIVGVCSVVIWRLGLHEGPHGVEVPWALGWSRGTSRVSV